MLHFNYFKLKSTFSSLLESGSINNDSICFIEDTKEIGTHGNFFCAIELATEEDINNMFE